MLLMTIAKEVIVPKGKNYEYTLEATFQIFDPAMISKNVDILHVKIRTKEPKGTSIGSQVLLLF